MGKRSDKNKLKLCVLTKIKENKTNIFGGFSCQITKQTKKAAWQEIHQYAQSIGAIELARDWTHLRDVWWPNVRKTTTEKLDNAKKTGTGGGRGAILTDVDNEVLEVIGKDSPIITGLNVPESGESDNTNTLGLIILPDTPLFPTLPDPIPSDPDPVLPSATPSAPHSSLPSASLGAASSQEMTKRTPKKKGRTNGGTTNVDEEKRALQIKLLKLQVYKTQLECLKLESELNTLQRPAEIEDILIIDPENPNAIFQL